MPKPAQEPAEAALPAADRKRLAAAGPDARPKRPRRGKVTPDRLELLVAAVVASLEDDKAEAVIVLDVTGRASYADRLVIATGLVERQIQAMAMHVQEALDKLGLRLRRDRIQASPDWVLLDAGDLVVHLFRPEARAMYALERMWGPDSPHGDTPAEPAADAPPEAADPA